MNFVQKVWLLLKPYQKSLYFIFAITLLFETVRIGGPYLYGKILDLLIKTNGEVTWETGAFILGGLAGVRIVSLIIDYLTDLAIFKLLWDLERYISTTSFSKLLELSLDYHEKENTGTKINLVNKGTDKLIELVGAYVWEFQPIVLQLIISAVWIFLISWLMGAVFIISVIPFLFITIKIYQSTYALRVQRHDAYDFSSGEIGDTVTNITVVKAFAQEDRERLSFQSIWDNIRSISAREVYKQMVTGFGRSLLVEVFYITVLILGIFQIKSGNLTVGSLVFLINLTERAYSNVYRLGRIYNRAMDATEPVERMTELMKRTPTVKNSANAIKIGEITGKISFKHVGFAYNKRKVLKNVSFTIPAGSFTALVGKSGSGKSTIAKLLSRYYDPTSGGIIIDDKYDLRELDLDSYRRNTSVVFQDSPVPNRTIWEVISYAAGKKTWPEVKERVIRAAKLAYAHEFIMELEDGYLTLVGERGVKLSGGQRQRLAIARALFAEPKILIMDEPTSHLDTLSESLIQRALIDISKQRTLTKIIIAHRLSTVQHADQILVTEKGSVVERGTHKELLKKNGVYAEIVRQSELKS